MKRARRLWDRLRGGYWFVPAVMAVGAVVLSFATLALDARLGDDWAEGIGWFYQNKAQGARNLLATVAGSMIGVAGVTFSIAIAAVIQAAQNFGPRLIVNFMRDRGNQVVLGTLIATFVYCLMVLRTIQGADEGTAAFVPHLSVLIGVALALASLGVLIYFLHHVPEMTNISKLIAGLGGDLAQHLRALRDETGRDGTDTASRPAKPDGDPRPVRSTRAGYVQDIDEAALVSLAQARDLTLMLGRMPGEFVREGEALALTWPAHRADDDRDAGIADAFSIGPERTPSGDVLFLADELVEVAARALSPGVNDPFTAMGCMDWLANALAVAAEGDLPAAVWADGGGRPRLHGRALTFPDLAERTFGRLRFYAQRDRTAALHFLDTLASLGDDLASDEQRACVARLAHDLRAAAGDALDFGGDAREVERRENGLERRLAG